mgnify:FL=1
MMPLTKSSELQVLRRLNPKINFYLELQNVDTTNEDAISHLKKSLEIDPKHLQSLLLLSKIYIENGNYSQAESYLNRVEQVDSHNTDLWFLRSKSALALNDLFAAKEKIEFCLKNKIYEEKILCLALEISNILKDTKFRVSILELYILNHEVNGHIYLELAKSLQEPNQYEKASYYFDIAQELLPNNTNVLLEIAKFHTSAKNESADGTIVSKTDYKKSKTLLLKSLKIKKEFSEALCLLGEIYFIEKDYKTAKKYFSKCYTINFNKKDYLLKLYHIARDEGDTKSRDKYLLESTDYKKLKPLAYAELCKINLDLNKNLIASGFAAKSILEYRRTIYSLNKEIKQNLKLNNFLQSRNQTKELRIYCIQIAEVYFLMSNLKQSSKWKMKCVNKSLEYDRNHPQANYTKAQLLKNTNNQKSSFYLKTCFENEWRHWQSRWEYIILNETQLSAEETKAHLKIILDSNPDFNEANKLLAKVTSSCAS